jgi:hypothetical protein
MLFRSKGQVFVVLCTCTELKMGIREREKNDGGREEEGKERDRKNKEDGESFRIAGLRAADNRPYLH